MDDRDTSDAREVTHTGEHAGAVDRLLAEQVAYYRARAPEYLAPGVDPGMVHIDGPGEEIARALTAFAPTGDVLELACGPGVWTPRLLEHADSVTAVDAAPEMLALARQRITDVRVRFVEVDLFDWRPDRRYDVVFFGFWLSHVPPERFAGFWSLVDDCLAPGGRVFFADDVERRDDELVDGVGSPTVRRRLSDGSMHRLVKQPHRPHELEADLVRLGWDVEVVPAGGPFYYGHGRRSARDGAT